MVSRLFVGLVVAGSVLGSLSPARAEVVDMAAITCGELLDMKPEEAGSILLWTHGYFGGLADDTKFDVKAFEEISVEIGQYCARNKKVTLLSAVKALVN
jgi:hypothetical protein